MKFLIQFGIWLIALCTLATSIRIAIGDDYRTKTARWIEIITHPGWLYSFLFVLLPWHLGAFARGETSPIPWEAFTRSAERHGFLDGVFSFIVVTTVDLWFFWIPAQLVVGSVKTASVTAKITIRIMNVLVGLLLVSPYNPIYTFLTN